MSLPVRDDGPTCEEFSISQTTVRESTRIWSHGEGAKLKSYPFPVRIPAESEYPQRYAGPLLLGLVEYDAAPQGTSVQHAQSLLGQPEHHRDLFSEDAPQEYRRKKGQPAHDHCLRRCNRPRRRLRCDHAHG